VAVNSAFTRKKSSGLVRYLSWACVKEGGDVQKLVGYDLAGGGVADGGRPELQPVQQGGLVPSIMV
jgi:hypothetical protein